MSNINLAVLLATLLASSLSPAAWTADVPAEPAFEIKRYDVSGNSVLESGRVEVILATHAGETMIPEGRSGYVKDADSKSIELPKDPGLVREFPAFGNSPGVSPAGGGRPAGVPGAMRVMRAHGQLGWTGPSLIRSDFLARSL